MIVGNTVLYGATAGRAFFRGLAGERFAVRNSGAIAVVEGVGDHGCEYMTGGRVVVLGPTGRNFAAGMSGGIAYVLDEDGGFAARCNTELVGFDAIDRRTTRSSCARWSRSTASAPARRSPRALLDDWEATLPRFVKVMPHDYKRALAELEPRPTAERRRRPAATARRRRPEALMGELGGFLEIERVGVAERDPRERVGDYREFFGTLPDDELRDQGARCMDCGVPFCHNGCPLGNLIPDWNDLVYRDRWREAIDQLHATNNFPEFTGLLCPAPCEAACVLEINEGDAGHDQADRGRDRQPRLGGGLDRRRSRPTTRTGRTRRRDRLRARPGWRAPQQLNRAGHARHGLRARRGARRAAALRRARLQDREVGHRAPRRAARGRGRRVRATASTSGATSTPAELRARHDAVVVAIGSRVPRDLPVPGRELDGVHFAMEYLYQRNRWVARAEGRPAREPPPGAITAAGKHVVVVGGGDTGADCVANAHREGAEACCCSTSTRSCPASGRPPSTPWPLPPKRTHHDLRARRGRRAPLRHPGHALRGADGRVDGVVGRARGGHLLARRCKPIPGSEFERARRPRPDRDRLRPSRARGAVAELGLDLDRRGNVKAPVYGTKVERRLRLRRRPHRPVARGHRDRRGPPLRPRGRPVPRGLGRGPPHLGRGDVRLRGRRPAFAASPGGDRPHGHGRRRFLVRPSRRALARAVQPG